MGSDDKSNMATLVKDLADWISDTTNVDIYCRHSGLDYPKYNIKGGRRGPNIIVCTPLKNYGIVVRNNESSDNIHKGVDYLYQYWEDTTEREDTTEDNVSYVCDGDEVDINVFLLASQSSKDGHLFKSEHDLKIKRKSNDIAVNAQNEPRTEWLRSTSTFRTLYRIVDSRYESVNPGIGILTSSILCKPSDDDSSITEFTGEDDNHEPSPRAHYYTSGGIVWEDV